MCKRLGFLIFRCLYLICIIYLHSALHVFLLSLSVVVRSAGRSGNQNFLRHLRKPAKAQKRKLQKTELISVCPQLSISKYIVIETCRYVCQLYTYLIYYEERAIHWREGCKPSSQRAHRSREASRGWMPDDGNCRSPWHTVFKGVKPSFYS